MWRKIGSQNCASQNLTAFIQNLTFDFARLEIARGRKILRAFVNPLNVSTFRHLTFDRPSYLKKPKFLESYLTDFDNLFGES